MWVTLINNRNNEMAEYISNSDTCMDKVIPQIVQQNFEQYKTSIDNKVRSLEILYTGGMISKRKYTNIRNTYTGPVFKDCEMPKILSYKALISFINTSIEIGDLYSLQEFGKSVNMPASPGVYRQLEPFILRLAYLYLSIHAKSPILHWFNGKEYEFLVTVGADAAPFGRDECATAYLVSFLNLLKKVNSCDDNHLLMGASCSEDDGLLIVYTKQLFKEMEDVERKVYDIEANGTKHACKFILKLIPSDMKWMATMCGELNNAATYFSSFANVNKGNMDTRNSRIGTDPKTSTWQPWTYKGRLDVANKVTKEKSKLTASELKGRTKVTQFIAKSKSRQEFVPPLGKYVDCCKAEPLHNCNNAWQQWFCILLTLAISFVPEGSLKSCSTVNELPSQSAFVKFMTSLKEVVKCTRLWKNICKWFSEGRKKNQALSYRFTGKESKLCSWGFQELIKVLLAFVSDNKTKLKLHVLSFIALKLRDSASIFSQFETNDADVGRLTSLCSEFFNAWSIFLGRITPTVWTIAYAVPFHPQQLVRELGNGLGLNSMQGREAKHIKLKKYMEFTPSTSKHSRWLSVFKHEFVNAVWLKEKKPESWLKINQPRDHFIPKCVENTSFCYCGLKKIDSPDQLKCEICNSQLMHLIETSAKEGKLHNDLKKFS
ncbi:uncharacterized protein LOC116302077 [Actinia tenebrosa]|uniref:Uncharacterized protein LOC116302077 n=1 Tax=Actinia tenebrosa TaxID=6105 RepID=A0A6P8IL27_ACTTE|nr:uncharacterized protein LOC116302077 [Actinia tenebrosa]